MNHFKLKDKNGDLVEARITELSIQYIDKIIELQDCIYEFLDDKQLYSKSTRDEFIETLNSKGKIIGVLVNENELIAIGVFIKNGYDEHNYGYDINIKGDELLKVGQIESTIVLPRFRGNKLQKLICKYLEKIAKDNSIEILCATASPYNKFSVNTFLDLGYEIKADKLKYGGLRRYVLVKHI